MPVCWSVLFVGGLLGFGAVCAAIGNAPGDPLQWAGIVLVTGTLAGLGAIDGKTRKIDPLWLSGLVGAGTLWWVGGSGPTPGEALIAAGLGAAAGFAFGAVPIAVAEVLGRRWPFQPGDALLFAAMGWVLGLEALPRALVMGAVFGLAYGGWLRRRRRRPLARGHVPLGPGMAAGGIAAFLGMNLPRTGIGPGLV